MFNIFSCIKNCRSPVDPKAKIALGSTCFSISCKDDAQYEWSVYYGSHGDTWQNISDVQRHFETSVTSLVIEPFTLEPGRKVRVDLTVRHTTTVAIASYYFTVNTPPQGGRCLVTPTQGVALRTRFEFNCYNWTDEHQPIAYSFSYMTSDGINIVLYSGLLSYFRQSLSPGNKNISIDIANYYGAYTTVHTLVKVSQLVLISSLRTLDSM